MRSLCARGDVVSLFFPVRYGWGWPISGAQVRFLVVWRGLHDEWATCWVYGKFPPPSSALAGVWIAAPGGRVM